MSEPLAEHRREKRFPAVLAVTLPLRRFTAAPGRDHRPWQPADLLDLSSCGAAVLVQAIQPFETGAEFSLDCSGLASLGRSQLEAVVRWSQVAADLDDLGLLGLEFTQPLASWPSIS